MSRRPDRGGSRNRRVKSVEVIAPVHKEQLFTYLKLVDKRLGLLINFNVEMIKQGITRIVNGLKK
jgi:GxxExxY protein